MILFSTIRHFPRAAALGALLGLSVQSATGQHHDHGASTHHSSRARMEVRSLDVKADPATGVLHVLYATVAPDETTVLWHTRSEDGGASWGKSRVVNQPNQPPPYARGRGTDFHISARDDKVMAVWMTHGSGFGGRGPLVAASSHDGGATWTAAQTPADDGTNGDHAFIDVAVDMTGTIHTVWLDTRHPDRPGKSLMTARTNDLGSSWAKNVVIDAETCECCWNLLQVDSTNRMICLYRDRDPRDMAVATSTDSGKTWRRQSTVGNFDWEFEGCPHAGGALVESPQIGSNQQRRFHAVVWTGESDNAGLHYLRSENSHLTAWSEPHRVGTNHANHPSLAATADGSLAMVWTDYLDGRAQLHMSQSHDDGLTWSSPRSLPTGPGSPDHPLIIAAKNSFHVFWTQDTTAAIDWRHLCIPTQRSL